jgi:dolichol kinase
LISFSSPSSTSSVSVNAEPAYDGGRDAGAVAITVMGLADVAAGFTGDLLKSESKTWWGTLACAVVACGIVLAGGYRTWIAAAVAVAVALVERIPSRGVDNLTVPAAAALLLAVLEA